MSQQSRETGLVAKKRALIRATQDIPPDATSLESDQHTEYQKPPLAAQNRSSRCTLREQFNDDEDEDEVMGPNVLASKVTMKNQNLRYSSAGGGNMSQAIR